MRVLLLGNNRVALKVAEWLRRRDEEIIGLVLHPANRAKYRDQIIAAAQVDPARIFDGPSLREEETLKRIAELRADIAVSVFFGYILRPSFLALFPKGVINLHPSYLPYNRGSYPNVWSIIEGTPAGATLHYVDKGIDTGDIIAQKQVPVEPVDTGATLYAKLEDACFALFQDSWPSIGGGKAPRISQPDVQGSTHRMQDVAGIDEIDLDRTYTARELINILRARTFAPYPGAYFRDGDKKIYVSLQLKYEDE